jgi:DNA-binding transcriptional ArsR family regulator
MSKTPSFSKTEIEKSLRILRALADLDRVKVLLQVRDGEKNVGMLAKALGIKMVNISHHLAVLRNSGVLKHRKIGRFVYYSLNPSIVVNDGALQVQLTGAKLTIGL